MSNSRMNKIEDKINLSAFDTEDTIKLKLSIATDRPFIYIDDDRYDLFDKNKIDLEKSDREDIIQLVKKYGGNVTELILETLYLNKKVITPDIAENLRNINPTDFANIDSIERLLENYRKERKNTMDKNNKRLQDIKSVEAKIKECEGIVKTTEFLQDSNSIAIYYEYEDLEELFDSIEPSDRIPFVELFNNNKKVYKIYNSYKKRYNFPFPKIPVKDNEKVDENVYILFYYYSSDNLSETDRPEAVWIQIVKDRETGTAGTAKEIKISMNLGLEDKDGEGYITGSIKKLPTFLKRVGKGIRGNFAIDTSDNINLNREIFLDFIMNDPHVSKLFFVDESRRVGPKTKDFGGAIYLNYKNGINASITEKTSGRTDPMSVKKLIPIFTEYINVRVTDADSLETVNRYRKTFETLIGCYVKNFDKIKKEYSSVIPSFKDLSVKKPEEKFDKNLKILQRAAPEIFIQGYSKKAEPKFQPILYDENDPDHKNLPINEFYDIKLVCPKTFPYFGLLKNTLDNKDDYPYIPRCYGTKDKNHDLWLRYQKGEFTEPEKKSVKITKTRVQKKAIDYGQRGMITKNIYYLVGKDKEYYRYGTPFDNNSFIHAVLLAVDKDYEDMENKSEYVRDIRRNLVAKSKQMVKQELWDRSDDSIDLMLKDDTPFDSKIFIGYLENIYKVNIYVINREEGEYKDPNGTFEIPRYTQAHLKKNRNKSILIYKHLGIFGQNLKTAHYELIRSENKKIFKRNDQIYKNLEEYYKRCYKIYGDVEVDIDLTSVSSENLDDYGKTRSVNFDDYKITMYTSPLSSGIKPGLERDVYPPVSIKRLMKFIEDKNLKIIAKDVKDGYLIGVKTDIFGYNGYSYSYISVKPVKDIFENLPYSALLLSPVNKNPNSIIKKTYDNRKIADFMMQLSLFSFSKYLSDVKLSEDKDLKRRLLENRKIYNKKVRKFVETFVVVPDNDFLKDIPRSLSLNSSFFKDGRLIVDSEKTVEKLEWYLFYNVNKNIDNLINYKNKKYLEGYYVEQEDYTQYPDTIIIIGEKNYIGWLNEERIDRKAVYIPDSQKTEPQFWVNWVFGNRYVIVQNVSGVGEEALKRALYTSKTFINDGYNIGYTDIDVDIDINIDSYNSFLMKNGVVVVENYNINLPSVYSYEDGKYAAVLFV